jgi:hypothetical protein
MKIKIRQKWILIVGLLIIALGIVHVLSTFFFYKNIDRSMFPGIFMFVATGLSVVLSGSLTIYCSKIMETSEQVSSIILKIVLLYFYLISIGAIVAMMNNPFSYIMLLLSVSLNIPVLYKQKEL